MKSLTKRGFTLVETMIGVTIIGLLASISIPAFSKVKRNSDATGLANNFRTYAAAFEIYAIDNGGWPADVSRAVIPTGMEGSLPRFNIPTIYGAKWDWDHLVGGVTASVSLRSPTMDFAMLEKVDAILDDGNLNTGRFIRISDGGAFILEK